MTDKAAHRTSDIRKTLTDPTPLYFAAGLLDKIREAAPERLAAVRGTATDPKAVQERFSQQAKQTQTRLTSALSGLDVDLKKLREQAHPRKLREQAQHLALQGVGLAAEYAVKAREGYGELAERGRGAVQTWRGERNGGESAVEEPLPKARERAQVPVEGPKAATGVKAGTKTETKPETRAEAKTETRPRGRAAQGGAAKKAEAGGARKTTARKTTARRTAAAPTPKTVAKKAAAKSAQPAEKAAPKPDEPQA